MKTRKAIIKCTGEQINVIQERIDKKNYQEVVDEHAYYKFGRRFNYTELEFAKQYDT